MTIFIYTLFCIRVNLTQLLYWKSHIKIEILRI